MWVGMAGGGDGREVRRKRQASLSSTLSAGAIVVVGLLMILSILIKGRKTKGSCVYDQPTRCDAHSLMLCLMSGLL